MSSTGKRMADAETARYGKINALIGILTGEREKIIPGGLLEDSQKNPMETLFADDFKSKINVGGKITIDGDELMIGRKTYGADDLQKVTINTEGSMKLYDRKGKKLCGTFALNLSVKNIEYLCIWLRLHNVAAEVRSGKGEKAFQWAVFATSALIIILIAFFKRMPF